MKDLISIQVVFARFELWLLNLIREPDDQPRLRDPLFWIDMVQRLKDAELSVVADRLYQISLIARGGGKMTEGQALWELGELYLLARMFSQYKSFSPEVQQELAKMAGWYDPNLNTLSSEAQSFSIPTKLPVAQSIADWEHWISGESVLIKEVYTTRLGNRWTLRNKDGVTIPLTEDFKHCWALHALSGGNPIQVGGVWMSTALRPIYTVSEVGLTDLNQVVSYKGWRIYANR